MIPYISRHSEKCLLHRKDSHKWIKRIGIIFGLCVLCFLSVSVYRIFMSSSAFLTTLVFCTIGGYLVQAFTEYGTNRKSLWKKICLFISVMPVAGVLCMLSWLGYKGVYLFLAISFFADEVYLAYLAFSGGKGISKMK